MRNWKSPGLDGIDGFWLKKFTSLHQDIVDVLSRSIQTANITEWTVESQTILIQKGRRKGNVLGNYRPIACLNLIWKLSTGIIAEKLYDHIDQENLWPEKQKGSRHRSQGTKDQILVHKAVISNSKRRKTNLNVAWIDFKKAYMVSHKRMIKSLHIFRASDNVIKLLKSSLTNWKMHLVTAESQLGVVNIRRVIFQGDSLIPLLFVEAFIQIMLVLRKMNQGYSFGKRRGKINHLLFMDDQKLYDCNDN